MLKNEFGDVAVDSTLAQEQNISQVQEISNGCLCCTLVGQFKSALEEIIDSYAPDRILIETSGSAFPAPIAWQLRQLEQERQHLPVNVKLDGIVTVIDCLNFRGYEDTSYTAKMQAQYTDLIVMNKHEVVSEREYDLVLDHVYELNPDTPVVKASRSQGVDPALIFGLDTSLFPLFEQHTFNEKSDHMENEVDLLRIRVAKSATRKSVGRRKLLEWLQSAPFNDKERVYRIKGLAWLNSADGMNSGEILNEEQSDGLFIVNVAFGGEPYISDPIKNADVLSKYTDIVCDFSIMGVDLRRRNGMDDGSCCDLDTIIPLFKEKLDVFFGNAWHPC